MLGDMLMDKTMLLPNMGKVCRSLFGPVDHDEVKKTLQRELRVFEERSRDRWNFDFKQEQPLPGRYEYETVTEVPAAYNMPHISLKVDIIRAYRQQEQGVRAPAAAAPATREGEAVSAVCAAKEDLPTPPLQHTATTQTSPHKRKRQTEITDFYPKKKVARTETPKSS